VAGTTFIVAHVRPDGRRRVVYGDAGRDGGTTDARRAGGGATATTALQRVGRPSDLRQTTERAPVAGADGGANAAK
jgi:hypothetical protein